MLLVKTPKRKTTKNPEFYREFYFGFTTLNWFFSQIWFFCEPCFLSVFCLVPTLSFFFMPFFCLHLCLSNYKFALLLFMSSYLYSYPSTFVFAFYLLPLYPHFFLSTVDRV